MQLTTEDFIKEASEKHSNKYDYSKVVYTNALHKVTIICPTHGEFRQEASSHKRGCGCPKCSQLLVNKKNSLTHQNFLEKSRKMHGELYNYTNASYKAMHKKVAITCKEHGDFLQTPTHHIRGRGCPSCNKHFNAYRKSYYKNKKTIFYVIELPNNLYKVGITTRTVETRYRTEDTEYKILLEQHFFNGEDAWTLEKHVIKSLKPNKYTGPKVLKHTANSEIFTINPIMIITQRIKNDNNKRAKVPI